MLLKIALLSPKGPLYRQRGGIFRKKLRYAPRTLPLLAALVPPDLAADIVIYDEGIEEIPLDLEADLVGMTVITGSARRAYELAAHFRGRKIPVVLGGPHVTLVPEDAAPHADAIVVGYAEKTWPELLIDLAAGRMKPRYDMAPEHGLAGMPHPRWDLVKKQHYLTTNVFEATRGCIHNCDFCVVPAAWGRRPYHRPIPEVVAEIRARGVRRLIFVDLNLIADRDHAMELFAALLPLKLQWFGLSTSLLVRDPELLELLARSGCRGLLIGFESLDPQSLKDTRKIFNAVGAGDKPGAIAPAELQAFYRGLVKKLHAKGISVQGCFAFGADHDTPQSIIATARFAVEACIDLPRYAILTPFPGTDLHRRLQEEDRIIHKNWEFYDGQHVVFKPAQMTPQQLLDAHETAWKLTYGAGAIFRRLSGSRTQLGVAIAANLGYRFYAYHLHTHYNCDWFIGKETRVPESSA